MLNKSAVRPLQSVSSSIQLDTLTAAVGPSATLSSWTQAWYQVEGLRIHCVETGIDSSKTPVVLMHGLGDSHLTWRQLAVELARDRRVLIPDLPGHGLSDRPNVSYQLSWYSQIMAKWLQQLAIPAVDLIGHSLGGGIAQMLLLTCRQSIRRLALLAPGGLGREISPILRIASLPYVVEYFGQPFMRLGTKLSLHIAKDGRSAEDISALSLMNKQAGSARAFARTVRDLMDLRAQRHTFYQRAHEIKDLPPMRVLWGKQDNIIPVTHGERLASQVSGVKLVTFEACGHFLHQQQPSLAAKVLQDFFNEANPPAARLRITP